MTETAPYGWEGDHSDLEAHIAHTVERRLVGTGLTKDEVAALAAYVRALPLPPAKSSERTAAETHGETIFRSAEAGCSGCHEGASLTDRRKHDVSSGGRFDTPSLLSVGNTAPYFHDGRYTTLRELLRDTDDRMGHTKQLDAGELDDLEAYLFSL